MDRKKPSLTSPWKVGFLVALLLVVTALGVSYFITGTFGVAWHWIHAEGLSPLTWKFNPGAFVEEMAPLLLLTSLLAFAAYVLVVGAVRRYESYVDSGVEYKQLLKSIKNIASLEDEDVLDQLKQHPELREFMMGIKHRVAAIERQHAERDKKPVPARENRPALANESASLAAAIIGGPGEFPHDLALTTPELKQIERAVRESFILAAASAPPDSSAADAALEALRSAVRGAVTVMRRDVIACGAGAREVEAAVSMIRAELQEQPGKPAATANPAALQKRVDVTAEALAALGEEARRIAIASAMQASGGPESDTIRVADELRTMATRFNTLAQHWRETAPALKQIIGASAAGGSDPRAAGIAATAATAASKATLWGERAIAMNDAVRALEAVVGIDAPEEAPLRAPAFHMPDTDVEPSVPAAPAAHSPVIDDSADDFVPQTAAEMFAAEAPQDASFADIPGFEKEKSKFFVETPGAPVEKDERFVVDGSPDKRWDLSAEGEEAEPAPQTPAAPPKKPAGDSDVFLTGPRPTVPPARTAAQPSTPRMPALDLTPEAASSTATMDADADAIDLYALGAVDCVQTM